jgi:hypothetical protein
VAQDLTMKSDHADSTHRRAPGTTSAAVVTVAAEACSGRVGGRAEVVGGYDPAFVVDGEVQLVQAEPAAC